MNTLTQWTLAMSMLLAGVTWTSAAGADDDAAGSDRALVDAFDAAARAAVNTPGMESTFHAAGRANWARMLRRELLATEQELQTARTYFQKRLEQAQAGPTWPAPPSFDIPRATRAPVIDGDLDDPAWSSAVTFTQSFPLNTKQAAAEGLTTWKMLWDDEHLYFAFDCRDADLQAQALPRDHDDVYKFDCVEMFILPRLETAVYWEIVINPVMSVFDGLQAKPVRAWGAMTRPELDLRGLRCAAKVRGSLNDAADRDEGYRVEVAVPFAGLPEYGLARPAEGQTLRLMLVRLDRSGGGELTIYAFTPLMSWGHNIWNHATARLGPAPR
jgi:hypothetical protein